MKKILKIHLVIILIISILPLTVFAGFDDYGIKDESNLINDFARNNDWTIFPEINNVPLSKEWTIEFSGEVTKDKIDGIVIDKGDEFIPVKIRLTGHNQVIVTPVEPYKVNSTYTLKIFLNNGNRYRMNFKTTASKPGTGPITVDQVPYDIKILPPNSIGTVYMNSTYKNNTQYPVTTFQLTVLRKDVNKKTYLMNYDTVMPGESSSIFDTFGPSTMRYEDIEPLELSLRLELPNNKYLRIEYDFKLDRYKYNEYDN